MLDVLYAELDDHTRLIAAYILPTVSSFIRHGRKYRIDSNIALNQDRFGWVNSPNQRETMDIVWSCVATLLICLWSMLHLNVPAANDNSWTIFWRKARWLLLGILAPELPMLFACGQWASANRSVDAMRALGYDDIVWSLIHAFYADSGGFVLEPSDCEPFPITAKQVRYLVQHGYIDLPKISTKEIWDKSNADKFTKVIAYLQTGWLAAQTMGHAAQRLPITPIELSTIALSLCSLTTLWFWLYKPLDVMVPTCISTKTSIATLLLEAGEAAKEPYQDVPLDFIEPRIYMSRKWNDNVLHWICRCGLQARPLKRIPNDRDPQPSNIRQHCALGIAAAAFASIHLTGWNFSFATSWESTLWRANSLVMCCLLGVYGTAEIVVCAKEDYQNLGLDTLNGYKMKWPACLVFFIPAALYFCTRLVVMFEVIYSLSNLPAGAFVEVQWSALLPHI